MTGLNLVAVDLVTHSEVAIDVAPEKIWPFVIDIDAWHPTTRMIPAGGPRGETGEYFHAVAKDRPDVIVFHATNVELEPFRRRTLRLQSADGNFIGYSSWRLSERGGGTILNYDVYTRYEAPAEYADGLVAHAQAQTDAGLGALKALAESG